MISIANKKDFQRSHLVVLIKLFALFEHSSIQRLDATEHVSDKEQVIDGALLFMSNPGLFWNRSGLEIKKRVQDSIFPEGLEHDCETGFGTAQMAQSYLVIQQIADISAKNPKLVDYSGTFWNQVYEQLTSWHSTFSTSGAARQLVTTTPA